MLLKQVEDDVDPLPIDVDDVLILGSLVGIY